MIQRNGRIDSESVFETIQISELPCVSYLSVGFDMSDLISFPVQVECQTINIQWQTYPQPGFYSWLLTQPELLPYHDNTIWSKLKSEISDMVIHQIKTGISQIHG